MEINLPRLSDTKIDEIAENFLKQNHSSLVLPIPIEEIAESKLNLDIIPVKTLRQEYDVDGSLDSTLKRIFIDFDLYMDQENRTRFTIAHEIGHLVLHHEIFKKLDIKTESDLHKLIENINNEDYRWLEHQAYSFAGHVLVPSKLLVREIQSRLVMKSSQQITAEDIYPIFSELTSLFKVSGEVILRRLQKIGLVKNNRY